MRCRWWMRSNINLAEDGEHDETQRRERAYAGVETDVETGYRVLPGSQLPGEIFVDDIGGVSFPPRRLVFTLSGPVPRAGSGWLD